MSSMRQIARLAGVSVTTVSLALRNKPDVSARTREIIKDIAQKLNYTLPRQTTSRFTDGKVIGYIIHEWFWVMATNSLRGAMAEARGSQCGLLMMEVPQDAAWIEEAINNLLDMGISGLVIAHSYPQLPRRILLTLRSRGIHAVQIMHKIFADPLDSVCRYEAEYARVAAEHLSALGHRRVLLLNMPSPDNAIWEAIFRSYGMEPVSIPIARGAQTIGLAVNSYLHMDPRPTAIVATTDEDAFRLYHQLRDCGLHVPGDVSIMGMGNIDRALLYPEITTIDFNAREMGRLGIRLLIERITAGIPPHDITDFQEILLPAVVVSRSSTGPVAINQGIQAAISQT